MGKRNGKDKGKRLGVQETLSGYCSAAAGGRPSFRIRLGSGVRNFRVLATVLTWGEGPEKERTVTSIPQWTDRALMPCLLGAHGHEKRSRSSRDPVLIEPEDPLEKTS